MDFEDIFDQRMFDAMAEKRPWYRENICQFDHDWNYFVELCDANEKVKNTNSYCLELSENHLNPRLERFAKRFMREMKKRFPKNGVSLIGFSSFRKETQNFKVHKDRMDVIIVQRLGTIEFSFFKTEDDISAPINIRPKDAEEMDIEWVKLVLKPGDMVYIPRGTFHYINPLESRLTYSFGFEGKLDVARYLQDKSKFD